MAESDPFDTVLVVDFGAQYEVPGVNRVAFDITSKPPGAIEWE